MLPPPSVLPGCGEEDLADEAEIRDGVAVRVVDVVAAGVLDVAALGRLVAVGPLVVAGRVDERVAVLGPEVEDRLVVGEGAVLLAGVDVPDVNDEPDAAVVVDRVDERRRCVNSAVSVGVVP